MINDEQTETLRALPTPLPYDIPSEGDPRPRSTPVPLPCHGPDCVEIITTHLTDADVAVRPTLEIRRIHPKTGDERRSTVMFCSEDCRSAFIGSDERTSSIVGEV